MVKMGTDRCGGTRRVGLMTFIRQQIAWTHWIDCKPYVSSQRHYLGHWISAPMLLLRCLPQSVLGSTKPGKPHQPQTSSRCNTLPSQTCVSDGSGSDRLSIVRKPSFSRTECNLPGTDYNSTRPIETSSSSVRNPSFAKPKRSRGSRAGCNPPPRADCNSTRPIETGNPSVGFSYDSVWNAPV